MQLAIERDVSLAPYNTFGVDVCAARFVRIGRAEELGELLADPSWRTLPRLVLGGGSNLLLTRDFEGQVIRIEIPGFEPVGVQAGHHLVRVGAGENWHGTGERRAMDAAECRFGYRDSVFKQSPGRYIVLSVTLALPERWQPVTGYADVENELKARGIAEPGPRDVFDAVVAIRRRKLPDPAVIGNAGSFFKNPVVSRQERNELIAHHPSLVSYDIGGGRYKLAAGWLIDACGLKGYARGRAAVYDRQALVLVNRGGATGAEILELAHEVQARVAQKFGVALEPEPVIV
jgi:UDP-N-acetylmuramate dehydrogenase